MNFQIPWNVYQSNYRYKYLALYHALRDAIVGGGLPYGCKLPSSRDLADMYVISRGIVSQVYEMLVAEGYLVSGVGSGTYVSFNLHQSMTAGEPSSPIHLSEWGWRLDQVPLPEVRPTSLSHIRWDFTIGHTDGKAFPISLWNRALYRAVREGSARQREEAFFAQGHLPLREAIAKHLSRTRGIPVVADDVVIVNGSMQAIALLAQLLVNPGEQVVMEDPGYRGIRQAVSAAGGEPVAGRVDDRGMVPEDWEARLLFVTASRQFPTGAVLSLERRQELLNWAVKRNAVIVEDDYDSEFRHKGRPIEPLKLLDTSGRVVYIGTFSKTLFSDIRIGYVVLPPWLRAPFCKAKYLYEPHPTGLTQQHALADFMNSGQYERHLRRMKRIYSKKHALCRQELQQRLGSWFEFVESDAGLHVFGWWKGSGEQYESYRMACREAGIVWSDAGSYIIDTGKKGACFGFAHLAEEEIVVGIRQMAELAVRSE